MEINNQNMKKLYRSEKERVIAGVAGGLGEYLEIDPTLVRLIFVGLALFGGSGLLIYLVLWIIVPSRSHLADDQEQMYKDNFEEMKKTFGLSKDFKNGEAQPRNGVGIVLLVLGVIFIAQKTNIWHFGFGSLWPIILIALGVYFLNKKA